MRPRNAQCRMQNAQNAECRTQDRHRHCAFDIVHCAFDIVHFRLVLSALLVVGFTFGHATAAASRDFMWKVTGKTGAVYLIGSVHMLTQDFYPLSKAFEDAFKESDLLVEEVDLEE